MSSTNRGSQRLPYDQYETPPWAVERFLDERLKDLPTSGRWIEPCAGSGSIIRTVNSVITPVPKWTAAELWPKYKRRLVGLVGEASVLIGDFLTMEFDERFAVAITNPPFSIAYEVIQKCLRIADWVIMLLRVNWLGSETRHRFLTTFAPDVHVLPNRISFRGAGETDSVEYGWFLWGPPPRRRSEGRLSVLGLTPKEVRADERWRAR